MTPTVVIASRVFEPETAAAAYRLGHLARALERRGARVVVLTTRSPDARRGTERIRRWPVLRDRSGAVRGYLPFLSFDIPLLFRLLFAPRAAVIVAEPPPTTGLAVLIIAAIRRIPYVYYSADVTSAAMRALNVNPLVRQAVTALERSVLRRAASVLAVSEGVVQALRDLGVDDDTVQLVGTGIDTQRFSPEGPSEEPGHPYFVYAGTMSEFQGAEVFVTAFSLVADQHPDARLYMFGGGVDLPRLRQLAAPLGDRIQFPGYVDADVVGRWTRGAVAGLASVRPGRGYDFAVPTKAFASAACGTPVIFAGAGPLSRIVSQQGFGRAVAWDATVVAKAMSEELRRPRRLDSAAITRLVSRYSLSAVADRAAEAVIDVVRAQRSATAE